MSTDADTILLVTDVPFWREEAGAHRRIASLCRTLDAEGYNVAVFYPTHLPAEDSAIFQERFPVATLFLPPPHLLALRLIRTKLGIRGPLLWERRRALRYLCLHCFPRFVIAHYLHTAPLLEGLQKKLPFPIVTLIDTIDVQHLRSKSMNDPNATTREEEAKQLDPFDAIIAIQDQEAAEFQAMCPDSPVIVAGHTHTIHPPQPEPDAPIRLLFIAAEGAHNVAAINNFLTEVWPQLTAAHRNNVELHIAGNICDHLDTGTLPHSVTLDGFVDDLHALYASAHIVINPLYAGSGLKIKNVEALCHSLPLVTTPVGAQGLEDGANESFLVCESPDAMRTELDRLITSPTDREALRQAAHAYAETHFTPDSAYHDLLQFLQDDVENRTPEQ